jgi:hypothetical protein
MIPCSVNPLTIRIPFQRRLKTVAIADPTNARTNDFLASIAADNFQVEMTELLRVRRAVSAASVERA